MSDATPEVQVKPKNKKKRKPKREPRFSVVLWNDDVHTFQYVIVMLQALFGYPPEKGMQLAQEVHNTGRAVVFTSSLEKAELKRDQVLAFGEDPWAEENIGPLGATLERCPD
ncbi:MAG: ATP-dependent Clp protease adaptor ClpS [Planctomycetaceae bacterium]|nr:ATP-dependent Clp protease adaptor ClpS [Planctomycetaceae bacterium]